MGRPYAESMTSSRMLRIALTTGALALVLGGCGTDKGSGDAGASPSSSPSSSPSAAPSTDPSTAPSTPVTPSSTPEDPNTPSPTAPPAAGDLLLTAAELPRLNPGAAWTQSRDGQAGTDSFGACQKFDLASIGATSVHERTFTSGGPGARITAGQQLADFPDPKTVFRAAKVLTAWHDDCKSRLQGEFVKVWPISAVTLPHDQGWWYLASTESDGVGHFHSTGVVTAGAQIALLTMTHQGQDHIYPAGKDPMVLAVQAAAAKLN